MKRENYINPRALYDKNGHINFVVKDCEPLCEYDSQSLLIDTRHDYYESYIVCPGNEYAEYYFREIVSLYLQGDQPFDCYSCPLEFDFIVKCPLLPQPEIFYSFRPSDHSGLVDLVSHVFTWDLHLTVPPVHSSITIAIKNGDKLKRGRMRLGLLLVKEEEFVHFPY
jgi:hypothetical protein